MTSPSRIPHRLIRQSLTRRHAIGAVAGAALSTSFSAFSPQAPGATSSHSGSHQMPVERSTFVLVHGGWHGSWCWRRVAPLLRAAGHDVWTPTLTGLADRAHALTPETDLETHIRDIVGLLEFEDLQRVNLVGHSYAGMVIAGAAAKAAHRIRQLVYLDAFVPHAGDSLMRLLSPEREYFYRTQAVQRDESWLVPPPPVATLGVSDPDDVAWLEARLTFQPLRTFDQALDADVPAELPQGYIHSTEGPIAGSFTPFAAQARADAAWEYAELASGHDAMVTAPIALAELLLGFSRDSGNRAPERV
jgi:pimeloyl-ACP methyl ester carboxylesterase